MLLVPPETFTDDLAVEATRPSASTIELTASNLLDAFDVFTTVPEIVTVALSFDTAGVRMIIPDDAISVTLI